MILTQLVREIEKRIKEDFPSCEGRVFSLPSKLAYCLMESYPTCGVNIVHAGSANNQERGQKVWTHKFDIFIYRTIWDNVVLGDIVELGLIPLIGQLYAAVKNYDFSDVFPDQIVGKVDIPLIHPTEDFVQIGAQGYSGTTGLQ